MFLFLMLFTFIICIIYVIKGIVIVNEKEAVIIEFLGQYSRTLYMGFHFINPIFEKPKPILTKKVIRTPDGRLYKQTIFSSKVSLNESVDYFLNQNIITNDNVTISIKALLYYQIIDPKKAVYNIENLTNSIEKLTLTNLRKLVGELTLDETFASLNVINDKLREFLDKATDKWGVKVNHIELYNIDSSNFFS